MDRLLFLSVLNFFLLFLKPSLSDPRATEAALVCSNRTAPLPERPTFVSNFVAALEQATRQISRQRYSAVTEGSGNATVYAFGQCIKDLNGGDCNFCFAQSKTQILRCLPYQTATRGGRLFFDGCYLRYDDYDFFNETLRSQDRTVCASRNATSEPSVFRRNVGALVRNLSAQAPTNGGFLVANVSQTNVSVYGLAQCWEFVNSSNCRACLADAVSKIGACPPKEEGRVLNAGCYMRYSTQRFYYNNTGPPPIRSNGRRRLAIIAATSSVVAFVLMIGTALFFVSMKIVKKRRERKQVGALLDTVNKSKINFSYELLEKATDYFNLANKLGQGGFGCVYKGTLPDGRVVAVKRLLFNTRQWVDHFFNEVNLISGIHHRNLVQLLGCSITGPESLLVYEYVPNQNVNDHLFVKDVQLSWELRYKIILGTAEGLAYLHGESQLRIIHRDIKLTNILVDNDFTPKIADFGLARLFPEDKTHVSTAIAGTFGYMAPEYVVCGKLTEKADVYSFGVLVIEVITRKRNKFVAQGSFSILHTVWGHYQTHTLVDIIDPALKDNHLEEASRLLQIGLLCVQATVEMRPSMSTVVTIISSNDSEIAVPTQPPFMSLHSSGTSRSISSQVYDSELHYQSSGNVESEHLIDP